MIVQVAYRALGIAALGAAIGAALRFRRARTAERAMDANGAQTEEERVSATHGVTSEHSEFVVSDLDRSQFAHLLLDVRDAFGREDFRHLRTRTSADVMAFFADQLTENALNGRRNEVRDAKVIALDIAHAWQAEGYANAIVIFRFSNIDVIRDRATGLVIDGELDCPVETVEHWHFVRGAPDQGWILSAIRPGSAGPKDHCSGDSHG